MLLLRGALAVLLVSLAAPAAAGAQEQRTIYSSLPLQGASEDQAKAIVRGARLALSRAGGRAGSVPIRYVSLDDSTRRTGTWTPERVQANARRAAGDPSAIAYLGEFNSGASALSIPVLNEAGIPQVSPSNTAVGLTADGPGADKGEPDKYYPNGSNRTFFRLAPSDTLQAAALARLAQERGLRRVYVVDDGEVYGRGIAAGVRAALAARGIAVAGSARLARQGRNASRIARRVRAARADGLVFGGITANGAPRLFDAVNRRNRRIPLLGSDGVAESGFTREITRRTRARTSVAVVTLPAGEYPAPPDVLRGLGRNPDPYALFGYEAMAVTLDAIARAGAAGNDRNAVRAQLAATRDRDSVLGRYSFDPNGDTTLTSYGIYAITRGGSLRFRRAVDTSAR